MDSISISGFDLHKWIGPPKSVFDIGNIIRQHYIQSSIQLSIIIANFTTIFRTILNAKYNTTIQTAKSGEVRKQIRVVGGGGGSHYEIDLTS